MAALADLGETWLPHRAPHTDAVALTIFIFRDWDSGQCRKIKMLKNQLSHLATPPSHFRFVVPKSGLDIADCEVQV